MLTLDKFALSEPMTTYKIKSSRHSVLSLAAILAMLLATLCIAGANQVHEGTKVKGAAAEPMMVEEL